MNIVIIIWPLLKGGIIKTAIDIKGAPGNIADTTGFTVARKEIIISTRILSTDLIVVIRTGGNNHLA